MGRSLLGAASQAAGRSLLGLDTGDSPTFAGLTASGRVRADDLRIGDGSTYDGYLTYGAGYFQLSAVSNHGLQFKANNSVALTIAATGAAIFSGVVSCGAAGGTWGEQLLLNPSGTNKARIAYSASGGYRWTTGVTDPAGNAPFTFRYEEGSLDVLTLARTGVATFGGTTASTSTTTGALVVGGGIGVGGSINAGGQLAASVGAARIGVRSTSTLATAYNPTAFNDGNIVIDSGNGTGSYCGIRFTCGGSHEALFSSVQTAAGLSDFVWSGYNGGSYVERARLKSDGTFVVVNKITTVSAVPASFADLAAVRTWLAAQFT